MSMDTNERGRIDDPHVDHQGKRKRGRPALNASDQRANRRDDIIRASSHLFFHTGYTETTLRRVATKAQVNVALIHYYFTNKQGLYLEVLTNALGETLATLKQYQQSQPTLAQLTHALTHSFVINRALARTLLLPEGPADALDMIARVKRRIRQLLHATLQTMQRTAQLPRQLDTDLLTSTFLDLCWGPIRGQLETTNAVAIQQLPSLERQIRQNTKLLEAAISKQIAS